MGQVVGELLYQDAKGVWKAELEETAQGGYALYLTAGENARLPGGVFSEWAAAVKFVRTQAEKRFGRGAQPFKDTLADIEARKQKKGVIPTCLQKVPEGSSNAGGRGLAICPSCPYRSICGNPVTVAAVQGSTGEADESFIERLRRKTAAMGKP